MSGTVAKARFMYAFDAREVSRTLRLLSEGFEILLGVYRLKEP